MKYIENNALDANFNNLGFFRLNEVLKMIPVSKTAWYVGVEKGIYPKPDKIGLRASGYRKVAIFDLIRRIEERGIIK